MKRAHIVYAHPEPGSFVAAMRDTTQSALEQGGWQTSLTDLQASHFKAVASASDFGDRARSDYLVYSLEQRHAWKHQCIDPEIVAEVEAVRSADLLVLVFPIFWFSVPALMKGWIDRVFLSGVFYGGRKVYDRAGMQGKHALVVASLGGREHMFGPGAIHGELKGMLRHLLQGTLGYVGFSVYEPFFAHHVPYVDDTTRAGILANLRNEVHNIDSRPVLSMPSLDNFDDEFRPKAADIASKQTP
ncbi:MAG TPA: NAD(P)H-dependent oxidoreductase [Burkholderiaceae bacterium]|nr:NAD(P)H-dependent oxidoreductase [Burkholderiaceae bacterium]